jgi:hypothetical protein
MALLFYLDDLLTDQPVNDNALTTSINRNPQTGVISVTQDAELVYAINNDLSSLTISGFTYLKDLFDSGICNECGVKIMDQVSPTESILVYVGVVKVPNIRIDLQRWVVSTKVEDNSFYSYVDNNKSIEVDTKANVSKSKITIETCPVYECDMFASNTFAYGAPFGFFFYGYKISDLFSFLLRFITDGKVGFRSDYLESPSNGIHLFLFDGSALATSNSQPNMVVSFQKLFTEIFKVQNVSFYIDASDKENPILRLEESEFFYKANTILSFTDIKEMKVYTDPSKLYGTVRVGSTKLISGSSSILTFNEGTSYFGWKEETYSPIGQCNLDQELNLINEFAISSNMINNQLIGAVDSNLEDLFMVQMGGVDTTTLEAQAVGFSYFGAGLPRYYNLGLNNVNKLQRHGNNFQTALVNTQQINGDGFRASLGSEDLIAISGAPGNPVNFLAFTQNFVANGVTIIPIEFADEFGGNNYDAGGNYTNAGANAGQYLVPLPGDYSFTASAIIDVQNLKSCVSINGIGGTSVHVGTPVTGLPPGNYFGASVYYGVGVRITVEAYDDSTLVTLIASQEVLGKTIENGSNTINCTLVANLVVGNVVVVKVETFLFRYISGFLYNQLGQQFFYDGIMLLNWSTGCTYTASEPRVQVYMGENSYFECNGTPDGGVNVASNDPSTFAINVYEFEYPISVRDFEALKANPVGSFDFEKDGVTRSGWIKSLKRNDKTGLAQISLLTKQDAIISN